MNVQMLVGNIGQAPELKTTSNGGAVMNASLATDDGWYSKDEGRWVERVTWHRLFLFGPQAERFVKSVGRGQRLAVTGTTLKEKYTGTDGVERESVKVRIDKWEFAGPKANDSHSRDDGPADDYAPQAAEVDADGVPF